MSRFWQFDNMIVIFCLLLHIALGVAGVAFLSLRVLLLGFDSTTQAQAR